MSLRSDALTIKNETTSGANTANRIGGLFQDIADVTETVNTISALRAIDVSSLSHGDIVWVKRHSGLGLLRSLGGGPFRLNKDGLFEINNVGGYSSGSQTITVTPTTGGFNLPPLSRYSDELPTVVFDNGVTGTFRQTDNLAGDRDAVIPTGTTSIDITLSGSVPDGAKAFYPDDDGIKVLVSSGDASFERVMECHDNWATPEMFGAVPNYSSNAGDVNECSAEIQKAFDSEYNVRMYGGAYNINSSVVAERGKTIMMPPTNWSEIDFEDNRRFRPRDWATSCLYSTNNITYVVIRCTDLKWHYGMIDARFGSPTKDKAGFRYDMSANVAHSDLIRPLVICDKDWQTASADNGLSAVLLDTLNATNGTDTNTAGIGSFYFNRLEFTAGRCHTAFHYNGEPIDETADYYANSADIHIISMRNKMMYNLEQGLGVTSLTGYHQTDGVLSASQEDLPVSVVRGYSVYYDVMHWDLLAAGDTFSEPGANFYAAEFIETEELEIGHLTRQAQRSRFKGFENVQGRDADDLRNTSYTIPASVGIENTRISRLTNHLAFFNLRHSYKINAYDGVGYDFDANLIDSEGTASSSSDITITNGTSVVDLSNNQPCTVDFAGTADADNEFVEIVLETSATSGLWCNNLSITLDFDEQKPKRIQKFTIDGGTASDEENILLDEVVDNKKITFSFLDFIPSGTDALVIRLIGYTGTGSFTIDEVYGSGSGTSKYLPYIHSGGGQTIEGDITVDDINFDYSLSHESGTVTRKEPDFVYQRTLTSAEILTLNSSPITILDSNALGGAVYVKNAYIKSVSGSTDYATNTTLRLRNRFPDDTIYTVDISDMSYTRVFNRESFDEGLFQFGGGGIEVDVSGGDPTTGDRDLTITVEYELIA